MITVTHGFVQACLMVALAALGWGALSFVIPRMILSIGKLVWLHVAAPAAGRMGEFDAVAWQLFTSSLIVSAGNLLLTVNNQADYLILGYFTNAAIVGSYYFAYNISLQTTRLIGGNVVNVLFPALVALSDSPARQIHAYLRSIRLLAIIVIPASFLQAILAGPILELTFSALKPAPVRNGPRLIRLLRY